MILRLPAGRMWKRRIAGAAGSRPMEAPGAVVASMVILALTESAEFPKLVISDG